MQFWKMNGAGNDFIILNNLDGALAEASFSRLAQTLCERRLSIGADGLMIVEKPTEGGANFRMRFYNSDGTIGEMCGNGARCIARYGVETGLSENTPVIETTAGIVTGERIDRRRYRVRLNDPTVIRLNDTLSVEANGRLSRNLTCHYVELGNPGLPHAAIPYTDLQKADENELRELGRAIRWYKAFPKGANVNFYEITGPDTVYERTFERGVEDFTYACGTGTGSVVTVLTLLGQVSGKKVQVDMRGGRLTIDVERDGDRVTGLYLTGPTNIVAKGEVCDEDLI